jgi:hypothetical protein
MFEPENVHIAVALVKMSDSKLAIAWNGSWDAFVLPMTKLSAGPPAEKAEQAAVRAAAEVFQLPCRVVPGKAGKEMRMLQLSASNSELKNYCFTVVPVEIHPDFKYAPLGGRPVVFADFAKLQSGEYQPVSPSVKPILDECVEWGWF